MEENQHYDTFLDLVDVTSERCLFYIMTFLTPTDVSTNTPLRLVSKGLLENVRNFPWKDRVTLYYTYDTEPRKLATRIQYWYTCFPYSYGGLTVSYRQV